MWGTCMCVRARVEEKMEDSVQTAFCVLGFHNFRSNQPWIQNIWKIKLVVHTQHVDCLSVTLPKLRYTDHVHGTNAVLGMTCDTGDNLQHTGGASRFCAHMRPQ